MPVQKGGTYCLYHHSGFHVTTKDIEQLDSSLRYVVDWQPWPREKTWKLRYSGPAHVRLTSIFIQQIQQAILDAQCSIHYLQFIYSNCAVYSTFVTVSDRGSQIAKCWEPHFRENLRQEPCTVKPACNGTARDQTFFPLWEGFIEHRYFSVLRNGTIFA